MKTLRFAAALLLPALAACDELPVSIPQSKPAEYKPELSGTVDHALCLLGFQAVPLRTLITGHHVVDGVLDGKTAAFILDTGANISVVHQGYAKDFGLESQNFITGIAVGLGGGMQAKRARVRSLSLGGVDLRQNHIMTANLSQLVGTLDRISDKPIHGIIGQDVLKEHRAVIDTAKPMLYVQKENTNPAPIAKENCLAPEKDGAS